jgi:hypothetical protein
MSYIIHIMFIYLAWILQLLKFGLLPFCLIILKILCQTVRVVCATLIHNDLDSQLLKCLCSI